MDPKVHDGGGVAASTAGLARLESEPGAFSVYLWKSVIIACWSDRATGALVRRVSNVTIPLVVASPGKVSFVHMVEQGAGLPTADGRAGFIEFMDRHGDDVGCVAVVLPGVGFWASAFQGAITGMHMLSPRSFPLRIESRIDAAAAWVVPTHRTRTGAALDPNDLTRALNEARATNVRR